MGIVAQSIQSVGTRDCALALAIPLTREEFLRDLTQSSCKSFAKHVKSSNFQPGASDEYYWETVYGPIIRVADRVRINAEKLGVTVSRGTRLADLRSLLEQFKVVTVVAHWRFMRIEPSNVLDPVGLLAKLSLPRTLLEQAWRRAIIERSPTLLDARSLARSPENLREPLATVLNEIVAEAHGLYRRMQDPTTVDNSDQPKVGLLPSRPLERLTTTALELSFPREINLSKPIEFVDGMYAVSEVIERIPINFNGLLDLTICNSVILGEAIKNHRPACLVAVNRYPAELHVRLGIYAMTILMLSRRRMTFMDALARVATKEF